MVTIEDEMFDELVDTLIKDFLDFNPLMGTHLGLHEYDTLVPDLSKERMEYIIKRLEEYLKKFKNIDKDRLTNSRRIDYEPIVARIEEILILLRDWPTWRMYPIGYELTGSALFPLLIRDHLPLEHRLNALYHRIKKIDLIIINSLKCVDNPYKLWIEYTLMTAKGLPSLINIIRGLGQRQGFTELVSVCDKALDLIRRSISEVRNLEERARLGFKPIGRELFERLLKLRFIDEDIETLRKIGYQEAERYRKLMQKAAKEMGVKNISEGFNRIKQHYPKSKDEVYKLYKETVKEAREFLIKRNILDLPPFEKVNIIETPEYMRHIIPFAAYVPPEVFSWSSTGIFLVTPPETKEMLQHHNIYDILNTVVHEAYPGHHLQLVYTKLYPNAIRKILVSATELIEGWAHYCEELVLNLNINPSPEYKFKVYHDALWRAVRVYVDIELSTGMITFEQAVNKLMKDAYLPKEGAYSEALRYTMAPGYQLCYNYGKRRILKLKDEVRRILGARYSDKLFHKLLLEEGALPLKIIERIVIEKAKEITRRS